ncbi:10752_t:CDS:2, partial [Gigaspora margarita]
TYRYWNRKSRKFTWSNRSTATQIDQICVSENLKDRIEKAEIEEMKTITGNDHSLVLLQLRLNSSFSRIKECALEEKQTTRLKNWEEYKSSLWKQLYTQVSKFLCSQDAEEIKKGL